MKAFLLLVAALGVSSLLSAYGVSPSRTGPGSSPASPVMAAPQPIVTPNATATMQAIVDYKPQPQYAAWPHIGLPEAEALQKDPTVLFADARAKVEYDQGHIPYAIPLPVGTDFEIYFKKYHSQIMKARKIVTYCHGAGCLLSDKCAEQLYKTHNLHKVAAFFGGWPQWQQANLPVEKSTEPAPRP